MAAILRYTKLVYNAFKEVNGSLKVDPSSVLGRKKLDSRSMAFFADYIDFVMNGNILSEETKIYIRAIEDSPADIVRAYNSYQSDYKQITSKQLFNHMYYDTKRLLELFPDDMILNIIYKKGDIAFYEDALRNAIYKKTGKSLLGKMTILKLPAIVCKERPSEKEIENFMMLFAPYTKKRIQWVEGELPRNIVGYLNYISSKSKPTEEEKELLERVKALDNEPKSK